MSKRVVHAIPAQLLPRILSPSYAPVALPGIDEAALIMATPANKRILADATGRGR